MSRLILGIVVVWGATLLTMGCRTSGSASQVREDTMPQGGNTPSATVLNGFVTYCGDCHGQYLNDDDTGNWDGIKAEAAEVAERINPDIRHSRRMPPRNANFTTPLSAALRRAMYDAILPHAAGGQNPGLPTTLPLASVQLPPGFQISLYAEARGARSMVMSPGGTLFVGTGGFSDVDPEGRVYAIRDNDQDGSADQVVAVARGLNNPNGVAFKNGDLYIAEINRILKLSDIENRLTNPPRPSVVTTQLPSDRHHGWKYIAFGPDGKLYVPVGAPCNICDPDDVYAAIHRFNDDGSGRETVASGVRNTVGFDWHPQTGELWFTDNGRDSLGDDIPPDELNRLTAGNRHFGYPYCHGNGIRDPQLGNRNCNQFAAPVRDLGPHVAALGMTFYTGDQFPARYQNQVFIAEHGSWNRSTRIGYRITLVTEQNNGSFTYEPFAQGWLQSGGQRWGRPVDVIVAPDGSLLVSDDKAGAIYRISYTR